MTPRTDLERRRRNVARVSLYLSLALVGGLAAVLFLWLQSILRQQTVEVWDGTDFESLPEVTLLRDYMAIDTSTPDGDAAAGAEFLGRLLEEDGIPYILERVGPKDANLWAVIEGDDPRALVLHHHIDVDPVDDPEKWQYPPFEGVISGPWIYGRGAFDMKSVAIAQLEAFRALARSGQRPRRTVIFLATSGEETGSDLGMRWILAQRPELAARFGLVLTEGGAVEGRDLEDVKYWGTEFVQKRVERVLICGDSEERLQSLRRELIAEGRPVTGLTVSPELEEFLRHYAPSRDREDWREALSDPAALIHDVPAFIALPGYVQSMFRSEAVPFPVQAVDGGFEMKVALQLAPGVDAEVAFGELLPSWRTHGLAVQRLADGAAMHGSAPDAELFAAIEAVLETHYPGIRHGPLYLPWTMTDARFLRARDIPTFGFSPFMVLTPEVLNLVAQGTINERIALPGYVEGIVIYRQLLGRLTGVELTDKK
ncbi:MAG: M20/M25/M40 family metallo-hydrolase [Acidobacteriota bacterium]